MAEKVQQREAKQGTNKPPVTTILIVSLVLCLIAGVALYFFAGATEPVGEEVGGAVREVAPGELPEEQLTIDPSIDSTRIEPDNALQN